MTHETFPGAGDEVIQRHFKSTLEIIHRQSPIPYLNISLGERVADEPTELDLFALYFPGGERDYELISTQGEQLELIQPTRQRLLEARVNQESLALQQQSASEYRARLTARFGDDSGGRALVDMLELPLVVIGFGHRVRDNRPVELMFHPAFLEPTELLEQFQTVIQNTIDSETI